MKLYNVDDKYVEYLKSYDPKVQSNKVETRTQEKPYVGIVLSVENHQYFVPLSSPKEKHNNMSNKIDFIKVESSEKLYAVINLNNMIPVKDEALKYININEIEDKKYKSLLNNEYRAIKSIQEEIISNASKLYHLVTVNKNENLINRCCNFKLLEEASDKYMNKEIKRDVYELFNKRENITIYLEKKGDEVRVSKNSDPFSLNDSGKLKEYKNYKSVDEALNYLVNEKKYTITKFRGEDFSNNKIEEDKNKLDNKTIQPLEKSKGYER